MENYLELIVKLIISTNAFLFIIALCSIVDLIIKDKKGEKKNEDL